MYDDLKLPCFLGHPLHPAWDATWGQQAPPPHTSRSRASSKSSAMVSPAAIRRFTVSLDKSWGSRGSCLGRGHAELREWAGDPFAAPLGPRGSHPYLSRMSLTWVLGQMVSSNAQACRAAQNRPCRLAGALGPSTLQDWLKTPSKQVRQESRS